MEKKSATALTSGTTVTAYKAFNPDFSCRDFKFEVGKSYEVGGEIKACENGFHACENPLDVLDYYNLIDNEGKLNRFGAVSLAGDNDRDGNKIASAKITIDAELTLPDFIRRGVDWIIGSVKSKATVDDGRYAQLAASGDSAKLAASGDYAQLAASGDSAKLAASGDSAKLAASGDSAKLAASGDYAQLAASGRSAKLAASGDSCVIAMCGRNNMASGSIGTHIAIAEFDIYGKPIGFAIGEIGKDGLLPGTYYMAIGGKLVEA